MHTTYQQQLDTEAALAAEADAMAEDPHQAEWLAAIDADMTRDHPAYMQAWSKYDEFGADYLRAKGRL